MHDDPPHLIEEEEPELHTHQATPIPSENIEERSNEHGGRVAYRNTLDGTLNNQTQAKHIIIIDPSSNHPDPSRRELGYEEDGETGYRTCIGLGADTGMEGDPWEGNQQYWYLLRLLYNTQSTKDSEHNPCTWRRHTIPASSMFELAWLGKAMQRVALLRRCLFPRRDVIRWNTTTLGEAYCL
jgi:hypothetical protein